MCGICGKLVFDRGAVVSPHDLREMATAIRHRGPDDEGFYLDGPVGLGFRRLSIIDLSTGHQPLSNEDGTVWVVFNGEIYNYLDLRSHLMDRGHRFATKTDTEVLVHLYEEYGTDMFRHLRGMFGFAIWDEKRQTLILARDRIGIKPLYYSLTDKALVFGSEIKAILADPGVSRDIDPALIDRFLTFYYMPGEETLFKNILKLSPGSYVLVRDGCVTKRQYWDLSFSDVQNGLTLRDAEAQLLDLLGTTVSQHMISDVPVGFLLSGGVDSTAMLSLAARDTDRLFSSYTVGFSDPHIPDERPYARLAAQRYGTSHHELTISSQQFVDFLPQYVWHMEEPVCEPPAIALYYVSQLARHDVKVLISGEGGDEAFAGYSNYRNLVWLERLKRALGPSRHSVKQSLLGINRICGSRLLAKYTALLDIPLRSYYYSRTSSPFHFFNGHACELYSDDFRSRVIKRHSFEPIRRFLDATGDLDNLASMLYVDSKSWLPDDLLVKADKMTMANSIELRVPFLDHKVLEFAASLPSHFKLHRFATKHIAKQALSSLVPQEILKRKKAGFPVPYSAWMRTSLKSWLHDVLLDRTTVNRGYFQSSTILRLLQAHDRSGEYSKELFSLAVLELWHRTFLDSRHVHPSTFSASSFPGASNLLTGIACSTSTRR
jgi:asparagine synthase (glutamine-hydrolysing)